MEINITEFSKSQAFQFSHSIFEGGDNAARNTWSASKNSTVQLIKTQEQAEAFRKHIREYGAWNDAEIAAWDGVELNALFTQIIAGDIREAWDTDEVLRLAQMHYNAERG